MNQERNPIVITRDDYRLLRSYVSHLSGAQSEMSLAYELERATVVERDDIPSDTVRLNSVVSVMDLGSGRVSEFRIVVPEKADIREKKVSVLAPMGTALIGFREGDEVQWAVPAGLRKFRIVGVRA